MAVLTSKVGNYFFTMGMDSQGNFIIELPHRNRIKLYDNGDIDIVSKKTVNIKPTDDMFIDVGKSINITTGDDINITTNKSVNILANDDININTSKLNITNGANDNLIGLVGTITDNLLTIIDEMNTELGISPDLTDVTDNLIKLKEFTTTT